MKQTLSFLAVLLFTVFTISSCSKKDDPANNDLFVGTYTGKTGYLASGNATYADGKVRVTKVGNTYNFNFIDNGTIPSITGVTISKGESGYVGTVNGYTGTINITASDLDIAVTKDGANWIADCKR